MIELRKYLYESILDNEDDLIKDNKHIKDDLYKKILGNSKIQKSIICIDNNLNIRIIGILSTYMNPVYNNLFSGELINQIKEMSKFSLSGDDQFFKINKKPITIDKIHNLHIIDEFTDNPKSKNLKINEADECTILVMGKEKNWIKYLKNIKINDTLQVYCHWDHSTDTSQQIYNLENINVHNLYIGCESFKDLTKTEHNKEFDINSTDNMNILDRIYTKNKFDKLYINNISDYQGTRFVVEKINTKYRYKFKQIKL